ncbi:MAG: D-aminoacyl-tRNA deacylase [Candidatus Aminicenantes bacterium]|nr:D-aminoacyl-tRNA deacylase [Candidatus Aminicenantes bacterium]
MKVVLQRVKMAKVEVRGEEVSRIERGLCLLVGLEKGDTEKEVEALARKVVELRIFPDEEGKMNLSLAQIGGEILAISQFTLAGSTKRGRRPSFDRAEEPRRAEALFNYFVDQMRQAGFRVKTGIFGAIMDVYLINDGPVTFILESQSEGEK